MAVVIVDGREITIDDQDRLNGIQVARAAGVEIPHYCWHAGLSVVASCRMCLVETGTKDPATGKITMLPKVVPACQTPAKDGTVFVTNSDKVKQCRAQVEEYLLIDHPIDCPICDKAGECSLQDYHFEHGQHERRSDIRPFTSRRRDLGKTVTLFTDRCVMCSRCVRFTREISGTSELMVIHRGSHEEIDVFPGYPLDNKLSGNVVDLCPVGALGDKDFLYQQRVWFLKKQPAICTGCATGCSIWGEQNQDQIYRIKPRENAHVNQWWMCDDGRYGFHYVHSDERLSQPETRSPEQPGWQSADWDTLVKTLPAQLKSQLASGSTPGGRLGVAVSPFLTVEEAYLLCKFALSVDPQAQLAMGLVPVVGKDETFAQGFTIRAEKCPNRAGVEIVLKHFAKEVHPFEWLSERAIQGKLAAAWITGGNPVAPAFDDQVAQAFAGVPFVVVQDLFPSPLSEQSNVRLPAASFAEKEGSYVNALLRLQTANWVIRPPALVWPEGWLYHRLTGGAGLYQSANVRAMMGQEIPAFAGAESIPETGLELSGQGYTPAAGAVAATPAAAS